jgi:hypothetical protein
MILSHSRREHADAWGRSAEGYIFSYLSPETRVPAEHPLRAIRQMTDAMFERLSSRFDRPYPDIGRPSIAPEKLLRRVE